MAENRKVPQVLVTVEDLLCDPALELEAVHVPPGSLGVPVSWVHATEQLDPRPHLRPSELVCTLGSSLVRPRAAKSFVEAVSDAGAAGICLGLGEVHLEPPRALVDAAVSMRVPLLKMPHGVPFLAVNDAVLKRRSEAEGEARRQETSLLSNLLELARDGVTPAELLETVSRRLGGEIRRTEEIDRPQSGQRADAPNERRGFFAERERRRREGEGVLRWEGSSPGPSEEFLTQLASVLEFASRESEREWADRQQHTGQLIDLVADGLAHPAALLPEIEARGLDQGRLLASSWPQGSEAAVAARWPETLVGTTARGVIVLSNTELVQSIQGLGLVCGYSSVVPLGGLNIAVSEARTALRLARSRGGVVGPEQLVSFEALLEQQPPERLTSFVQQLLMPLAQADEEGRGDLVETLRVYLGLDRQLQASADRLFVHVNTVRHRLARIQELSGRDPQTLVGAIDLRIALWAADRQRTIGHRMIRPLQ